jgi:hypothetical protein
MHYPFIADLVESFRYYDREKDEVVALSRKDQEFGSVIFNSALFNKIVVLTIDFTISPLVRYRLHTKKVGVNQLRFTQLFESAEHDHLAIRVHSLSNAHAHVQSYMTMDFSEESVPQQGLRTFKTDAIGGMWNYMRGNAVIIVVTEGVSRLFLNFEWFFSCEAFESFWQDILMHKQKYRFYKLLIRFNRSAAQTVNPYYNTISLDVMIPHTKTMVRRCKELYEKYKPLEHSGKCRIENLDI